MRLVDADALMRDIEHYHLSDGKFRHWVEVQPTIEPERKHGKWILMSDADGKYYACSECGEDLPRYCSEMPTWDNPYPRKQSIDKTDFCPNCGSDMRGEQNG